MATNSNKENLAFIDFFRNLFLDNEITVIDFENLEFLNDKYVIDCYHKSIQR